MSDRTELIKALTDKAWEEGFAAGRNEALGNLWQAFDEGRDAGAWNYEHRFQIENGTRKPIYNPYEEM